MASRGTLLKGTAMTLYCYAITPIDLWWGAIHEKDLGPLLNSDEIVELIKKAQTAFLDLGWDGDISEGPYYFALPQDVETSIGYMLKQDNSGNTFVASPEELPYLDKATTCKTTVPYARQQFSARRSRCR